MPLFYLFQFTFPASYRIVSRNGNRFIFLFQVKIQNIYMRLSFGQNQDRLEPVHVLGNIFQNQVISIGVVYQNTGNSLVVVRFIIERNEQLGFPYVDFGLTVLLFQQFFLSHFINDIADIYINQFLIIVFPLRSCCQTV